MLGCGAFCPHSSQQGSEENFIPLIGGEVAVAGGQAGGDDEQQADGTEDQASFCGNINLLVRDDYRAVPDEIHHLIGQPTLSPDDMDIARNLLRDQIDDDMIWPQRIFLIKTTWLRIYFLNGSTVAVVTD